MSPLSALITGLTTGGLTCFAVQGGLLLGLLARRENNGAEEETSGPARLILPVSAFLVAKLVAYTIAGFLLGWFGNRIALTDTTKIVLQTVAGVVMIIAGVRLFAPRFLPWLTFNPPSSVRRFIRQRAKSKLIIAPAILGFLTVFIPCGTTQAMELAAIASSNALQGAALLAAFTLGTFPLFLVIGMLARGSVLIQRRLTALAAVVVISLGLYTLNGVLVYTGSAYSVQNVAASASEIIWGDSQSADAVADVNPRIIVYAGGYDPDTITVPSGQDVTLTLVGQPILGCTNIFRIPQLNLTTNVKPDAETKIAAFFPTPGRYTFTCGMGMYTGTINAI